PELADGVVGHQILSGSGAGPVEGHARAAADHRSSSRLRGERERSPRTNVVVVVKVVLPVVAKPERGGQPGTDANLVLDEESDHLFEKRDVPVADLLDKRIGSAADVVCDAGKVERASGGVVVVEAA